MALKRGSGKDAGQRAGRPLHVKVPVGGGRQLAIHLPCRGQPRHQTGRVRRWKLGGGGSQAQASRITERPQRQPQPKAVASPATGGLPPWQPGCPVPSCPPQTRPFPQTTRQPGCDTRLRSRPSKWCGCPCPRRGGRRGPGGTTTCPARPWSGRGTRAPGTRCCADPTAVCVLRGGRGAGERAGMEAWVLPPAHPHVLTSTPTRANKYTHTHTQVCTCSEGAMSSSLATTSCVATSGFHCSAEQRLRLRRASGAGQETAEGAASVGGRAGALQPPHAVLESKVASLLA